MDIEKYIRELRKLFDIYSNDELSLCDLIYFDEQFDELINSIRDAKKSIVANRFLESLDSCNV